MRQGVKPASKGSQKWLQELVNGCPELLNRELAPLLNIAPDAVKWISPLRDDAYVEYQDGKFLDRLGIGHAADPLKSFWPSNGPQWDGLANAKGGQIILLEAKAHTKELRGGATGANGNSLKLIRSSLEATRQFIGVTRAPDWARSAFYQYANRLAHLYFLRDLNGIDAFLVFLYFLNAKEMSADNTLVPRTKREWADGGKNEAGIWQDGIRQLKRYLGISAEHPLSPYIIDVFIDVDAIEAAAAD